MMSGEPSNAAGAALREAHSLHRAGRAREAQALCLQVLAQQPRQPEALTLLGIIAAQSGDLERALSFFDQVLALQPDHFAMHNNRANVLLALRRPAAALAGYEAAIALQPQLAPAHHGRGKALYALARLEEAVASHDAALALDPDYAAAHADRAMALIGLTQYEAALASLDQALARAADYPGIGSLRGNALHALGRLDEALASYERSLAQQPRDARTHHNRGNTLMKLGRPEEAVASYDSALALDPNMGSTYAARLHARMHLADWRELPSQLAQLAARIERGEAASNPFALLALSGSAALQRQAARNWVRERHPPAGTLPPIAARARAAKLRIGYFSAELHGHATASLTAELFERHDRTRFELTAFSLGPDTQDETRRRLEAAFDRFLDVRTRSDLAIAQLARSLQIDIAVDLGGFTRGGRPGILALRAAPVQVSYLGYLGTMAAEYIDYLMADAALVPAAHRPHYAEKIAYLPSYQVNDTKRNIATGRCSREALGLPSAGFVFCCFNATYKITPASFDGWMRILKRVPGSLLYLLGGSATVEGNLRREAQARGIEPQRLLFGARLPAPQYLARYRAADLFLDTLPYNAGATASDALWAGLPLLTCTGETFAGRLGASLLEAVGLPELITSNAAQYEDLAVELAGNPQRLAAFRARLAGDLRSTPLFNTATSTRHLEAAYEVMAERWYAGLPPQDIRI